MNDFKTFITHLKLEALALAILMVALAYVSPYSMWWLLIGFPIVDIGMFGYLFNSKTGAFIYNLSHNATIPTLLIAYGVIFDHQLVSFVGVIWTFHTAVDRILGYGLKHTRSFHDTHLGKLKNKNGVKS